MMKILTKPKQPEVETMLTPDQVAKMLNVSKSTLCRLTQANAIPHRRISDRIVRYQKAVILELMNTRTE